MTACSSHRGTSRKGTSTMRRWRVRVANSSATLPRIAEVLQRVRDEGDVEGLAELRERRRREADLRVLLGGTGDRRRREVHSGDGGVREEGVEERGRLAGAAAPVQHAASVLGHPEANGQGQDLTEETPEIVGLVGASAGIPVRREAVLPVFPGVDHRRPSWAHISSPDCRSREGLGQGPSAELRQPRSKITRKLPLRGQCR